MYEPVPSWVRANEAYKLCHGYTPLSGAFTPDQSSAYHERVVNRCFKEIYHSRSTHALKYKMSMLEAYTVFHVKYPPILDSEHGNIDVSKSSTTSTKDEK